MNYIQGFLDDCQARGLTKHTIETYRSNVIVFLSANSEPARVGLDDLRSFLTSLRARKLQNGTVRGYFAVVSALYEYLIFEGELDRNPCTGFIKRYLNRLHEQQEGSHTRQLISIQDMTLLISAADGLRDLAILMTLAKTGMRRGELLELSIDDIDLRRRVIRIPAKAKRSYLVAFIDDELAAVLEKYLAWRKNRAKSNWLWISSRGGRIHKDDTGRMIAALGAELGLHDPRGQLCDRLTPHCFRHWFTTHLFRAGMDPQYIRYLRGDSLRTESWQVYNHIDQESVRQEYLLCMPRILARNGVQTIFGAPLQKGGENREQHRGKAQKKQLFG